MSLESGTYISSLVATNPTGSDDRSQGDDHIRLLKSTILNTFPAITGAVTPTHTELNYVDGVTSAIQTQLDAKLASSGYTAADVLAKLLTVDGAGSGLDADLLDGLSSTAYLKVSNNLSDVTAATARTNLGLVIGTDVLAPNGSAASLTSFPTLNQNTSGTAANATLAAAATALATPRNINGVAFDGTGNVTVTAAAETLTGSALPALSGAALTALTAANISAGTAGISITGNAATATKSTVPRSTTATTLAAGDVGKCVEVTTHIEVPNSTFAAGDAVSVFNNSASPVNITRSAGTQYKAGVDADDASIELAARGLATIWFSSATVWVVSGSVT